MQLDKTNIHVTDAVLVEQSRRGDSAAMEQLIIRYQDRIYNVILKMCANADDAAELSQETFVKVIENIDTFEGRSSFYTWVFRIAVNLTLNYYKRRVKLRPQSLDAKDDENNRRAGVTLKEILSNDNSPDPAMVAQNKELYEIVVKLLMKLDAEQRIVILLRDVEGMNYAQIASVLNIKLGTVKSRVSRARSTLREILDVLFCNNADGELKYLSVTR